MSMTFLLGKVYPLKKVHYWSNSLPTDTTLYPREAIANAYLSSFNFMAMQKPTYPWETLNLEGWYLRLIDELEYHEFNAEPSFFLNYIKDNDLEIIGQVGDYYYVKDPSDAEGAFSVRMNWVESLLPPIKVGSWRKG